MSGQFIPFGGVNQRAGPLSLGPADASALSNVKLHPVGSMGKREGTQLWETPSAGAAVESLALLDKAAAGRKVMLAFGPAAVKRAVIGGGGAVTWQTAYSYASSIPGLAHVAATGRYVHNSNTADPTIHGDCLFVADGRRTPLIETGLASAAGSMIQHPQGSYGDGSQYSGVPGYPNASTSTETTHPGEPRNWDTDPPAGFCLRGEGRQNRMYAWGFADDPNRIDYSELGVPWNWLWADLDGEVIEEVLVFSSAGAADGGYFYAIQDDGEKVVGIAELYGVMVVFKTNSTLIYSGEHGVDWGIQARLPVGCSSYRSVIRAGNDLYWWSEQGPVSLSAVQEYGDLKMADAGINVIDEVTDTNKNHLARVVGYHDRENFRLIWLVPSAGETTCDKGIVYYYDAPQRWSIWNGDYCEKNCVLVGTGHDIGGTVAYAGNEAGEIHYLNQGYDDSGEVILASYTTAWTDLGDPDSRKRAMWLDVINGYEGAEGVAISVGWDYTATWYPVGRQIKALGDPGAYFDYALFDEATFNSESPAVKRHEVVDTGYYMRVKFETGQDNTLGFMLHGWKPQIVPKGLR